MRFTHTRSSLNSTFSSDKWTLSALSEICRILSRWSENLLTANQLNCCYSKLNRVHHHIPRATLQDRVQEPHHHVRAAATKTNWCKHVFSHSRWVKKEKKEKTHLHSGLASVLSGQVTHVACLQCSGSMCPTACSNSCQYHTGSQSGLRGGEHWPAISDQLSYSKSIYCNLSGPCLRNNHLVISNTKDQEHLQWEEFCPCNIPT